jgi:hypothetical protein
VYVDLCRDALRVFLEPDLFHVHSLSVKYRASGFRPRALRPHLPFSLVANVTRMHKFCRISRAVR